MPKESRHPLVEQAVEFSETHIRPYASQFDQDRGIPRELIQQMANAGFLGSILPKEYGGQGLNPLDYGYLTQAIGKGCSSARTLLTVHTSLVGETLVKLGTPAQKDHYLADIASGKKIACFALSEPAAGSDAASIQTNYQKQDDGFVIDGCKHWISFGNISDIFLVFAQSDENISAFLVERDMPGVSTTAMTNVMAGRGSHLGKIKFDKVTVPKENLVGRLGMGFSFVANTALFYGRYSIAWAGCALAQAALEEMVSYARKREQFSVKIAQHQLVQGIIADAVTQLHVGRNTCEKIAQMRIDNDDDAVTETNIAKLFTSRMAMQVATQAVQILGANGFSEDYPVERLFREAKVLEVIEGSSQIQQQMIAQYGLTKYFRKPLKEGSERCV